MKSIKQKLRVIITGVAIFALFAVLHFAGAFNWVDNKTYDSRMSLTADYFDPSDMITLVLLDQQSLDWATEEMGWGYPWPRSAYGTIIDFFNRAGAASIAFDMLYTEPSIYGPEDDKALGDACERFGRVVETVYYADSDSDPLYPVKEIREGAAILGNVTSALDSDGTARRNRFYADSADAEPGLSIASMIVGGDLPDLDEIPKAKDGETMYVRFQKNLNRYIPYGASEIIRSELAIEEAEKNGTEVDFETTDLLDPELFVDQHVFFGLYAAGLFDICATPISSVYPGVGVHVCQLDTILNENYLRDVSLVIALCIMALMSFAGCLAGGLSKQANLKSILLEVLLFIVIVVVYLVIAYWLFIPGYILPVAGPLGALLVSFFATILGTYLSEGKQRRIIKTVFSQYLSPTVIEILIEHPDKVKLGGERREITAFFSDIESFTSVSENMNPETMTSFLNTYLSEMSDIILAHGGTIDKYEGDAIIAFWNAPTDQDDHARRGVEAAIECQKKLLEMQESLMKLTGRPIKQRIGLNTGIATVGNFGSRKRFDYTMMGDTVNLASRLEGINKVFGTYTLVSEATAKAAEAAGCVLDFHNIGDIAVVGRKESVRVYVPGDKGSFNSEDNKAFDEAYQKFRDGQFSEAHAIFASFADKNPTCKKYQAICERYIKNPPENWQGFMQATEK
ncbi:MAG: adenylate/guanylate cyclase domain-containing protein [Treponema sp.]|nr:adenylate/guanylate cyclase domain-containing protein [Treponema sp.]